MTRSTRDHPLPPAAWLRQGLTELSLEVSGETQQALLRYLDLLTRWNQAYNLTAVVDPVEMVIKHLLDSLAVLPHLPVGRILDVGSGAGLPAVPIALTRPDLSVTALDSNQKKIRFITQAMLELRLSNLTALHHRAENYHPTMRYDGIIARAFATVADFVTATAHLIAPGGVWLAMKGVYPTVELGSLPPVCAQTEVIPLYVPGLEAERHLVVLHAATSF